jgi:hypothetical protein
MFHSERTLVIQQIARLQEMKEELELYIDASKIEVVVIEDEPKIKIYGYYLDWCDADCTLRDIKKALKKPAKKLVVKSEKPAAKPPVKPAVKPPVKPAAKPPVKPVLDCCVDNYIPCEPDDPIVEDIDGEEELELWQHGVIYEK